MAGVVVKKFQPQAGAVQTRLLLQQLAPGNYFLTYQKGAAISTIKFVLN